MASLQETITLKIEPDGGDLARAGSALDALAERFSSKARGAAGRFLGAQGGGAGGASAPNGSGAPSPLGLPSFGGGAPGMGGGGGIAGGIAGVAGAALGGAVQGFGQAVSSLPPALASSATAVGAYGALGAGKGAIDATVGQIPVVGPILSAQYNAFSDAIRAPHDRAAGRVSSFVGEAARYGVNFTNAQIEQAGKREVLRERAAYKAEANATRIVHRVGLSNGAVAFGLSQTGCN